MKFDSLFKRLAEGAGPAVLPRPGTKPAPIRPAPTGPGIKPSPQRPSWLPTPGIKPRPKALEVMFADENQEETATDPVQGNIAKHDVAVYNKRKHKRTFAH